MRASREHQRTKRLKGQNASTANRRMQSTHMRVAVSLWWCRFVFPVFPSAATLAPIHLAATAAPGPSPLSEEQNFDAYGRSWSYVLPALRLLVNVANLRKCYTTDHHSHRTAWMLVDKHDPSKGAKSLQRPTDEDGLGPPLNLLKVVKFLAHDIHDHIHHLDENQWEPSALLGLLLSNSCLNNGDQALVDAAVAVRYWKNELDSHFKKRQLPAAKRDAVFKSQSKLLQGIALRLPPGADQECANLTSREFQVFVAKTASGESIRQCSHAL